MHKYARDAYNIGIRFIGGCCGFEAYHIRAVAEEVDMIYKSVKRLAICKEGPVVYLLM